MKRTDTLIHVHFHGTDTHEYYGSIAAIYNHHSANEIGVMQETLYHFNIEPGKPYTNRHCTIRKGCVTRKSSNRKPPVKVLRVMM